MNYTSQENKTEEATPNKIKKFKKNGIFQSSHDLNSFFILLFFFSFFYINKKFIFFYFLKLFILSFSFQTNIINQPHFFFDSFFQNIKFLLIFFLILFIGIFFILIISPVLIYKEITKIKFLNFNLNFLNILNNVKKKSLFDLIIEFFFSFFKIILVFFVSFIFVKTMYFKKKYFYSYSFFSNIFLGYKFVYRFISLLLMIFLIIAIIDSSIKYFKHFNNLKMTIQEIKDEQKELDGNPIIKQRIRFLMKQTLRKSVFSQVIKSNVIIYDSVNFAVAIQYNIHLNSTPIISAKGSGKVALRIIKIAEENNIPIFFSNSIAKYLYNNFFIGNNISVNLHYSIAKILAWAWKLKYWKQHGGIYPTQPTIFFNNS
ncbi:EscU/YscU/HrcU family type III secretion system export apparatus switch protein [Buchnera aphidicola]|uniref:Flagellar biosynthetic protein FlhB n=1 Tax=Buchnera aphidicola subsp. Cinara cedri (strain Cc) TaxID=372461 RepID=Q057S3_BUCCC|nr:EscU/YscU/HrcU family type III secretion system export apparatus switch protein [Buchnera aphidicola]ABJ90626.1 type III protein export, membrane component [Buchnera aphidicola BCc]